MRTRAPDEIYDDGGDGADVQLQYFGDLAEAVTERAREHDVPVALG